MLIVQKKWNFTPTWWCGGGAWDSKVRCKYVDSSKNETLLELDGVVEELEIF